MKNFQRRHDRMIRPTVRLMPTSESVKSGGKLKKARWGRGRGRVYLGKNMSGVGEGGVGSGNSVNLSWGNTLIRIFKYFFLLFASFLLIN